MSVLEKYYNLSQSNYATGVVSVDHSLCTGCTQCTKVCPATALEMVQTMQGEKKSQMRVNSDCISCGACTAVCHTRSISIDRFWSVPNGAYKTTGKSQHVGKTSLPRLFIGN